MSKPSFSVLSTTETALITAVNPNIFFFEKRVTQNMKRVTYKYMLIQNKRSGSG